MNFSDNSSLVFASQNAEACDSHVSIYYEQDQKEEEFIAQQSPDTCSSEIKAVQSPPVEIKEGNTISIDLPPMTWHGFDNSPKLLSVTNTGRTLLINGHWANGRPYIAGGPLGGNYLFSQIHFHCPSEHEIDGKRYPLEMHVVHYKTSYLTQERAVHERDGTVVLVYLFKLTESHNTAMSEITKLGPLIEKVNTRTEATGVTLDQLIKPFASNYYVYWGSVSTKKKSYLLQWIINCNTLCVTQKEVEELSNIIGYPSLCAGTKTSRMQPEDDAIFHVGQDDYNLPQLGALSTTDVCNICRCHEVTQVTCKCKAKKRKHRHEDADCGSHPVLVCKCKSKTHVCKSHCNIHDSSRVCSSHSKLKGKRKDKCSCSESKSVEKSCSHEMGTGENVRETASLKNCHWVKSKGKKIQKLFCELRTNEAEGEPVVMSECASDCSQHSLCEEKRRKKKSKSKTKCKTKSKSKKKCKSKSKSKHKCKTSDESDAECKSKSKHKCKTSDESDTECKSKSKHKCKTSDESDTECKSKRKHKCKKEKSDESDTDCKRKRKHKCKKETSDESDTDCKRKRKRKSKKKSCDECPSECKTKRKRKCENETTDGSETEGTTDGESEKSSSKSSAPEDGKSQDRCQTEAPPNTENKTSSIRFDVPEKLEEADENAKKKQETVVVQSLESVTGGLKNQTVSTAEVCDLKLTPSGLFSINSKITLFDDTIKEMNEKEIEIPEPTLLPDIPLTETAEDIKVLMEGTDKVIESVENLTSEATVDCETSKSGPKFGSRSVSRTGSRSASRTATRSLSRSGTNVKKAKTQDLETSEPVTASSSKVKASKSKSPMFDLKKKLSLKKDADRCESTNSRTSRTGASQRENSQSKLGKTKKANDSGLSQSAQEVKSPGTNETAGMNKSESKTPGDKKVSNSKLDGKKSSKRITSKKSKEEEKTKNKSKTAGPGNTEEPSTEIKTLFEKKQSVKKEKPPTGDANDVQVNFLLTPVTKSNRSCVLTASDSDFVEEKKTPEDSESKNVVAANYIVNTVTIPKSDLPSEKIKKKSRVCLLMEHLFRTENADGQIYKCTSQEYHVAIMYDLNILQEYKGKFHPQELSLGNCETLQLIPKYPELESSKIHLQDCTVGKESLDQICIRVKFLLKETETKQNLETKEPKPESPVKKLKGLLDESTQFNYKEPDTTTETGVIYARASTNGESLTKKVKANEAEVQEGGSTSKKTLPRGKEVKESQTRKIKMQRNPRSKVISEISDSGGLTAESETKKIEMEEPIFEKEEKKVKPLFVKRRKTVYFMYDKVERDESTGKKIFVGSFRTKEEVENIKREKKIIEENDSTVTCDKPNDSNPKCPPSSSNQDTDVETAKENETSEPKEFPSEKKFISISKDDTSKKKKNMVTLHKYKPKMTGMKKECKNVLVGRALNDLNKNSEHFKSLAEIAGVDKGKNPKISVFEMQESSKLERWRNSSSERPSSEKKGRTKNVAAATSEAAGSRSEANILQRPSTAEDSSVVNTTPKYSDPKESQAALILIPVEVESLSKIEVILIEHLSNAKKEKKEDESTA